MLRQIPIREVNQHLSRYIKSAERGDDIIITKRGRPVARLSAIRDGRTLSETQEAALARSLARMQRGYDLGGCSLDRDALHER